jgi:hypothetical protein
LRKSQWWAVAADAAVAFGAAIARNNAVVHAVAYNAEVAAGAFVAHNAAAVLTVFP